ncbi:MAG TPA: tRNA pseudouridine(55) synthase TruB [Actinomycetota bacterium]|nr:tRNA pseudouridine(55) synthase TruB [Actinomycetota bacterium]
MDGIVVVDKPSGMTSHDVVAIVRRRLGERRVGHAGTLDPDATGVLVLGVGRATRLLRFVEGSEKAYDADVVLGVETTSQDASGEVVAETDASAVTREDVERVATSLIGDIEQIPPMVSAVKVGGERLYRKARRGEVVDREPRRVRIHELRLDGFEPGRRATARFHARCSPGTYVRTLAHDLGRALGIGAHVSALRRTSVGAFGVERALALDAVQGDSLRPMVDAVATMPRREVDADQARAFAQGKSLPAFGRAGEYAIVGPSGLVGVAEDRQDVSRPIVVVADP